MSWLDDRDIKTMDLMREVDDFQKWENARYQYDLEKFNALKHLALDNAGLDEKEIFPSEIDESSLLGKPQWDADFKAGFEKGKSVYAQNPRADISLGKRMYAKVSKKHGSYWIDGFGAAIDLARGAYATKGAKIAKKMMLEAKVSKAEKERYRALMNRNKMPRVDMSEYPPIRGMEGPFRFRNGRIVYWDPKGGKYYDRKTDMYLTQREADKLHEDQNRSDAETAFFFFKAGEALRVFEMAIELGLADGEVTYDDTVDPKYGVGGYAVRFAPHVRATKADIMLDLAQQVYEYVMDEDHDEFVDFHNELLEITAKEKKGLKKLAKKKRKTGYREYNPLHDAPKGKFAGTEQLKRAGKGSYSHLAQKRKVGKSKKGGFQMQMTKKPCGRAARKAGVPPSKKYTRCWDGEKGYPWPSSDVSDAKRSKG